MDRKTILQELIDARFNGNQAEFARAIKRSSAQVNQWLSGHRKIGDGGARHIELTLNLGKDSQGKGYFDAPPSFRHRVLSNVAPGPDLFSKVPLISWVRAGEWHEAYDPFAPGEAEEWFFYPKKNGENVFALRVSGDSMTATHGRSYPDGCLIFVDAARRSPDNGDRIIAKLVGSDEVIFKVFVRDAGKLFLRPLNSSYRLIDEDFKVLGTVVGKWEDG